MRTFSLASICLFLLACNEPAEGPVMRRNGKIDESILNILLAHYGVDQNNSAWTITRDSSYLNAEFRNPDLALSEDEEFPESEVEAYAFPLSEDEYLFGDLNGDGKEEIVLYHEVMGATGPAMLDIFIFEGAPAAFKLLYFATAHEVSDCETGAFEPLAIVNGEIHGTAKCFAADDPRCCPSLAFSMHFKWNGKALELTEKKPLEMTT
jgi:hypothetical protein